MHCCCCIGGIRGCILQQQGGQKGHVTLEVMGQEEDAYRFEIIDRALREGLHASEGRKKLLALGVNTGAKAGSCKNS